LFGADRIAKVERVELPIRSGAEQTLDKLADEYAAQHKVDKAKPYDAVLKTAKGITLYRESLL
jgi:predicted lipoprotein with Yx(FWY)xxD motif